MALFRFPSWISDSRTEESPQTESTMGSSSTDPRSDAGGTKRRVLDTIESTASPAKRQKLQEPINASSSEDLVSGNTTPSSQMIDLPIGVVIDVSVFHFQGEILKKHEEIRHIEENLAKVQIAMEQLRRCHLLPFPTNKTTPQSRMDVSFGTGSAVAEANGVQPEWAPAHGVTDGPYTRHYARWLIPDPRFDGEVPEITTEPTRIGRTSAEGRATRNSADSMTPASKSRVQRGALPGKHQYLPSGSTPSKENAGPSILRRPDGQLVKLVCLDCHRENFGSTQGFINHCRIAHKREFKSHEEAAIQSGVAIDQDDVGGVADEKSAVTATGLVHPYITRSDPDRATYAAILLRINQSMNMFYQNKLPGVSKIPGREPKPAHPGFVPSSRAPKLSKFLQGKGFNIDLETEISAAKKIDLPSEDSCEEEDDNDDSQISPTGAAATYDGERRGPMKRVPARSAILPAPYGQPENSKSLETKTGKKQAEHRSPRPFHALPIDTNIASSLISHDRRGDGARDDRSDEEDHGDDSPMTDSSMIHDLTPRAISSNNAPSLVSDDEDYDEADDVESSMHGSDEEEEGSDVAEIRDDLDGEDKVLTPTSIRRRPLGKEEKHVSFVSPVKERRSKVRA